MKTLELGGAAEEKEKKVKTSNNWGKPKINAFQTGFAKKAKQNREYGMTHNSILIYEIDYGILYIYHRASILPLLFLLGFEVMYNGKKHVPIHIIDHMVGHK